MDRAAYRRYLDDLVERARRDPHVTGLVALGSAADRSHAPDEWSDHDVWVVTRDEDAAARLREDPTWLPEPDRIVAHLVETRHGRSVIYDDGHLVEMAVFPDAELEVARANDFRVLYDEGGIESRVAAIAERTAAESAVVDFPGHHLGRFVVHLLIGAGRYGRGERLSANWMIRGQAVASLLRALAASAPAPGPLDTLDPHRRVETVFPEAAARLQAMLGRSEIEAAASLLELAVERFPRDPVLSPGAVGAIRRAIARAAGTGAVGAPEGPGEHGAG